SRYSVSGSSILIGLHWGRVCRICSRHELAKQRERVKSAVPVRFRSVLTLAATPVATSNRRDRSLSAKYPLPSPFTWAWIIPLVSGMCLFGGPASQAFGATAEESFAIRRPMRTAPPVQKDGPRINEEINARLVHLIDKDGTNRGNVSITDALAAAQA